ncbi:LADA_0H08306g1_1 [Lachancea dasiensis]|uniref:E3 ubiquitin-protein ligase PEP5 n=1 Tax=Lachancea dasiensis TaxID=1072105 RepID=A0A1G4K2G7_9SACH|nr:LADA_0H08306g1_1 [Lachancea dasiensis]
MSFRSWRQFQFFENIPIRDPKLGSESPLFSDPTLSAACPFQNDKLFTAIHSRVLRKVNLTTLEVELEFKAYPEGFQITHLCCIDDVFLVSIAEQLGKPCSLKVWRADKHLRDEYDFHSAVEIKNGKNTFPLSAVSIANDLTCMAIGFVNGRIVLIRGDTVHDRGSKQRVIYEDPNKEPITSLMLDRESQTLFASTTSALFLFNTSGRNNGKPEMVLNSESGVDLNCSCSSSDKNEFICCFTNSIDFYKSSGEKRSLVTDLSMIRRVFSIDKDHLLILSGVQASNTSALNTSTPTGPNNRVVILDIRNKLIAMNNLITGSVLDIFPSKLTDEPSVALLTSDGTLHKISERPINEKLQIVEQKELFQIAIDLAEQHKVAPIQIEEIRKKFAEYLYNNGSKSGAIEQYLQCLNVTETSEVIAKFGAENSSSPDDISNLSFYLLSMMQKGMTNCDHVTLYIITLIKLKNEEGLHNFVNHFNRAGKYLATEEPESSWMQDEESFFYSDLNLFDLELVLRLLLDSGFGLHGYRFARKYSKRPEDVVDILITDLNDPHSALKYIKSLSVDDTLRVLISFSKKLLELIPNDTNALLIELFTGKFQTVRFEEMSDDISLKNEKIDYSVFYSYNSFLDFMRGSSSSKDLPSTENVPTYHPPRPALIFSSFINQPFEFVVFLEACLGSYNEFNGFDHDKQLVLTTLYDIYLSLAKEDDKSRQNEWKEKARHVYQESTKLVKASRSASSTTSSEKLTKPVDNSLMMLISQVNDIDLMHETYDESEQSNLKFDKADLTYKFESLSLTSGPKTALKFIEQYGEQEPTLYTMGLAHFVSSKSALKGIGGEAVFKEKILQKVLDLDLMPLLDVLQVLGSTNVSTFGLVQEILIQHIKSESQEIKNNQRLVESYETELMEKENKLKSLTDKNTPLPIKIKDQTCNTCSLKLTTPLITFKCGHIYHQMCLDETDYSTQESQHFQCPQCIVDYNAAEGMKRAQTEAQKNSELLTMALNDVQNRKDRFKVVTEFIGRGGIDSL